MNKLVLFLFISLLAVSCDKKAAWLKKIQGRYKVYEIIIDGKKEGKLIRNSLVIDVENNITEIAVPIPLRVHAEYAITHDQDVYHKAIKGTFDVAVEDDVPYLIIQGTYLQGKYEIKYNNSSGEVEFVSDKNYIKTKQSLKKYD